MSTVSYVFKNYNDSFQGVFSVTCNNRLILKSYKKFQLRIVLIAFQQIQIMPSQL